MMYFERCSIYTHLAANTAYFSQKDKRDNCVRETMSVYYEDLTEHTNTVCTNCCRLGIKNRRYIIVTIHSFSSLSYDRSKASSKA